MSLEIPISDIFKQIAQRVNERRYRQEYLLKICNNSNKFATDWVPDNQYLLDMEQSYVPLSLARDGADAENLETILHRQHRIVIKGGPGSGKSTLVRYIMLKMARAGLNHPINPKSRSSFGIPVLFPIKIDLINCNDGSDLENLLEKSVRTLDVMRIINEGNALCIFDGLDEIANLIQREKILTKIGVISREYSPEKKPNHFIVTTRSAGYNHIILAGADFSLYTLQALSYQQQKEMIHKYYQFWSQKPIPLPSGFSTPEKLASHLVEQMDKNTSFDRLRSNPLMLSQIVLAQYMGKNIPLVKKELYENCILQLIQRHPGSGNKATDILLKGTSDCLIFLGGIAFLLHQIKDPDAITLEQAQLILKELKRTFLDLMIGEEMVSDILNMAVENWGILTKSQNSSGKDVYKFANLSFEEYLIANLIHKNPNQKEYWNYLSKKQYLSVDWPGWQEIALLYAGMPEQNVLPANKIIDEVLKSTNPEHMWVKAGYCMLNSPTPSRVRQRNQIIAALKQQSIEFQNPSARDALEVLIQIEPDGIEHVLNLIPKKREKFISGRENFVDLIAKINEPLSRQILRDAIIGVLQKKSKYIEDFEETSLIEFAEVLGRIGDTRLGQFCTIPVDGKKIPSFQIGCYLVTNIEFQSYVTDSRVPMPAHWNGEFPVHLANHPVTNISYEDAVDYCKWLSNKQYRLYRLPSEAEWLLMAREGRKGNGSNYPWMMAELQATFLNYRSRYKSSTKTTPVGLYWDGRTPSLGICDVLGNVWEWTSTKKHTDHIVKGIGWDSMDATSGLNAFETVNPNRKQDNIGFRVLLEI